MYFIYIKLLFVDLLLIIVVKRYEVVISGNELSPDVTHLIDRNKRASKNCCEKFLLFELFLPVQLHFCEIWICWRSCFQKSVNIFLFLYIN